MNTGISSTSIRVPYPLVLALALIALVASILGASASADLVQDRPLMLRMVPTIGSQNTTSQSHNGTTMVVIHAR